MRPIRVNTPAWFDTFPHRVIPLPDEWLVGLLLRCDESNHWEGGTTLAHLRSSLNKTFLSGNASWIVAPSSALEYLGHLLAIPLEMLLATTYQMELARLYHPASPHAAQLRSSGIFHLCPACIAETRLLRRIVVLPHSNCCPTHRVIYLDTCWCGAKLHVFSRQSRPFTCHLCGLDWAQLPRVGAPPERFILEQKVLSCFEFFLTQGTPQLLVGALQRIREKLKKEKICKYQN